MNQEATTDAQQRHGGSDQKKKKKSRGSPSCSTASTKYSAHQPKKKKCRTPADQQKQRKKKSETKKKKFRAHSTLWPLPLRRWRRNLALGMAGDYTTPEWRVTLVIFRRLACFAPPTLCALSGHVGWRMDELWAGAEAAAKRSDSLQLDDTVQHPQRKQWDGAEWAQQMAIRRHKFVRLGL